LLALPFWRELPSLLAPPSSLELPFWREPPSSLARAYPSSIALRRRPSEALPDSSSLLARIHYLHIAIDDYNALM
jgi:hypothetical protein